MDQVSSFFENILTVEPGEAAAAESSVGAEKPGKLKREKLSDRPLSLYGTKIPTELDFSSIWNYGKTSTDPKSSRPSLASANSVLMDKLVEKVISMVVQTEVKEGQTNEVLERRIEMQKSRPPLSMNIMTKNANLLNLRLSSTFLLIDNILLFFNWTYPWYTTGVLLIITHLLLNPYLFSVLPLVLVLANVLIPHYLEIYCPETALVPDFLGNNPVPSEVAINDHKVPKPIPQFSREFVINFTDLQNHMVVYIYTWDFLVWLTTDYLYFKDESLSSLVYLVVMGLIINNLIVVPRITPFLLQHFSVIKLGLVLSIWTIVILFHPSFRGQVMEWIFKEETRIEMVNLSTKVEQTLMKFLVTDDGPDSASIYQEAEIYELQKLDKLTKMWELVGFTDNFYTINISSRKFSQPVGNHDDSTSDNDDDNNDDNSIPSLATCTIKLTKKMSLDKIKPPKNWKFVDRKWSLDLNVSEWVEQNLIEDLVNVDDDEKWVYDYQQEGDLADIYRRRRWIRTCKQEGHKEEKV